MRYFNVFIGNLSYNDRMQTNLEPRTTNNKFFQRISLEKKISTNELIDDPNIQKKQDFAWYNHPYLAKIGIRHTIFNIITRRVWTLKK